MHRIRPHFDAFLSSAVLVSLVVSVMLSEMSCSSQALQPPKWPDRPPCVSPILVAEVKPGLEEIVDKFGKHDSGPLTTELVRETCDKQIYRRDGFRIVLYTVPGMVRGYAENEHGDLSPAQGAACVARAKTDLLAVGASADTLETYRKRFEDLADDPDVGAAHYLNCSGTGELSYQRSLTVMVHELTHENTQGRCLYTSYAPGQLCFTLPNDLPSASIATVDELIDSDDDYLKKLGKAQQLYLFEFTKKNRGPASLFNEMNAYTAGLEVSTAILKHDGPAGLLDKDGKPEPALLPLVMLWTVKYLSAMKDTDPDFYSATFGPGTDTRKNIDILLSHGEVAYQNWTAQLNQHKLSESSSERDLWGQYLEVKKQLDGQRAAS